MKVFKPKIKSSKKTFFRGIFSDNDTVKINDPKLVVKKPALNSFFNQSLNSTNSTRRILKTESKNFETESGIYEEINLEAYGIRSKLPENKPEKYLSSSLESDENDEDYDFKKSNSPLKRNDFANMQRSNLDSYRKFSNEKKLTQNKLESIKNEIFRESNSVTYDVTKKIKTKNDNKPELLYEDLDSLSIFDKNNTIDKKSHSQSPAIINDQKFYPEISNVKNSNCADLNIKHHDDVINGESQKNANNSKKSSLTSVEENQKIVFESNTSSKHRSRKSESFNFGGGNNKESRFQSNTLMFNRTKDKPTEKKTYFDNPKMLTKIEPPDLHVRRRTIIDVIRQIGDKHESTRNLENDVDEENDSDYNNNIKMIDTIQPKVFQKDAVEVKHKKLPTRSKRAVGFAIIYGLLMFFFGVFLSLDTYSGKLGKYYEIEASFTIIMHLISIGWIIFLFIDFRRYVNKLNNFMENQHGLNSEEEINEIIRTRDINTKSFYSVINPKTGKNVNVYQARAEILENLKGNRLIDVSRSNSKSEMKSVLVDFTKKEFRGYLVDNMQPFNMYLKAGIGIFCLFSIVQSTIEIAEEIESSYEGSIDAQCKSHFIDILIPVLQLIFSCAQFLFIFLKGNIVISSNNIVSSILTIHLAVNNILVWYKSILVETLSEYYLHILDENIKYIEKYGDDFNNISNKNLTDCYEFGEHKIQKFSYDLKPFLYPATIEFSITCATIFIITWNKIGTKNVKNYALPPTKKHFKDVGSVNMPFSNLLIMLDCTKTSKGLFFGVLVFAGTIFSFILFQIFKPNFPSGMISEVTEIILLSIALVLTCFAYHKVVKNYSKIVPEINMFDIGLEILSLCGVYAYSINSLIGIFYDFAVKNNYQDELQDINQFIHNYSQVRNLVTTQSNEDKKQLSVNEALEILARNLALLQSTFQTIFILECLRRYADKNNPFMRKPAREIITTLLMVNVSLWFFDTFSAKRFDTKPYLIEHFGIIKWSIINAFSSPLAIFYRFHSSVCLSDIWYGLYYGENEPEESNEHDVEF